VLGRAIVQQLYPGSTEMQVMTLDPGLERILAQAVQGGGQEVSGIEPGLADTLLRETAAAAQRQEEIGLPAVLLGLMAAFWLVDGPEKARWLSEAEKAHLLAQRNGEGDHAHSTRSFGAALRNPRVYLFAFIYFSLTCASLTLNFWMPLMIRDFGVHDVLWISLYTVIPNAVGAVGLMWIARRSDRRGERRWHFAACTIGGGIALALLTLHLASFAAMMAILSIAAVLIFAALPIFWAVPSAYLSGKAAAAGIALISSIGITSGIVSPWVIGLIKTQTGSMDNALYLLASLLVVSGAALVAGVPPVKAGR